jgi:membrane protein DedA with SNARE-associated domain
MNNAVEYLLNHGCSVLFAWVLAEQAGVPIPSAPILLTAGALVGFGRMSCAAALGLPLAACLIGDCVWFAVGRRRGHAILGFLHRMSSRLGVGVTDISWRFSRYGRVSIVLAKFAPGFGILVPPLAASMGVSPLNFLLLDAFGALAWAGSHLLLGYLFRKKLETLASVCAKAGVLVAVSVVTAVALVVTIRSLRGSPADRNCLTERVSLGETGLNRGQPAFGTEANGSQSRRHKWTRPEENDVGPTGAEVDAPINY